MPVGNQDLVGDSVEGKWRLQGYDTFEGGDAWYPIQGRYDTEEEALTAADAHLEALEESQPTAGGQSQFGIQDQLWIIRPNGTRFRHFKRSKR